MRIDARPRYTVPATGEVPGRHFRAVAARAMHTPIVDATETSVQSGWTDDGTTQPDVVRIFVRRGHRTAFVFLEPDWTGEETRSEKK